MNNLKSFEKIDFRNSYAAFIDTFPVERISLMKKRLSVVDFHRIKYLSNGKVIEGYIVQPSKIEIKKYPVIIYNRGGNNHQLIGGCKNRVRPRELFFIMGRYAQNGFVVIASNYSGGYGSEGVDEFGGSDIYDVINLHPVLEKIDYADHENIGMLGYSRGGMMTYLCMAMNLKWLKVCATVGGLTDLQDMARGRAEMIENVYNPCFGGSINDQIKRSAIHFLPDIDASIPLLICHGNNDVKIPVYQSIAFLEKAIDYGLNIRGHFFEKGDHSLRTNIKEVSLLILEWFQINLR